MSMQVKLINDKTFGARNPQIVYADKMVRHINNTYPRISSTLIAGYGNVDKFNNLENAIIYDIFYCVRARRWTMFWEAERVIDAVSSFIEPVKKYKRGNCGESAHLSAIFANVNGIKNYHIAGLYSKGEKGLCDQDHQVLVVDDKKPYIIDAWLGFADYIPNAFLRFKNEFGKYFDINEGEKFILKETNDSYDQFLNVPFNDDFINEILKKYPEIKMR